MGNIVAVSARPGQPARERVVDQYRRERPVLVAGNKARSGRSRRLTAPIRQARWPRGDKLGRADQRAGRRAMGGGIGHLVLSGPLILAVPVAAAAGAVTFLSPCVLPLVPGYLSYVACMSGWMRRPPPPRPR